MRVDIPHAFSAIRRERWRGSGFSLVRTNVVGGPLKVDFDLRLLEELLALLDRHLARLEQHAAVVADPDAEGFLDSMEQVVGLGFAACQTYLVTRSAFKGASKTDTLDLGPVHRCGQPIVAIVNAAANYWKHHGEWTVTASGKRARTEDVIAALGVSVSEYTTSNVLAELLRPLPARFTTLIPFLVQWSDALGATAT